MRRVIAIAVSALSLVSSGSVCAIGDRSGGDTGGGSVNLFATAVVTFGAGGGGSGPVCSWKRVTRGEVGGIGGGQAGGPELSSEEAAQPATTVIGGVTYYTYAVSCPGLGTDLRFVNPNVTAADLFDLIRREVNERVPAPVHNMNPAPEVGGVVNLGLWLAVEPQTMDPVHAEAGPAWITATPMMVNATFDMGVEGNEDKITCAGLGTPYPEGSNDPDEGPCGYTYRQKLPDDAAYTVTITTEWTIPYTSSSGSGTLTAVTTSSSYDYNVDEIQTIGSS
jgi:hypothetical protein